MTGFGRRQLKDSTLPLVVVCERVLNVEFPAGLLARDVLLAVGGGATAFSRIRDRTGLSEGSLARTLRVLTDDKRVLLAQRPLSAQLSRAVQYLVPDAYSYGCGSSEVRAFAAGCRVERG